MKKESGVSSVELSATPTAIFDTTSSVTNGAVSLSFSLDTQSANRIFSGPASGGAATPSFRALVAADISTLIPKIKQTEVDFGTTPVSEASFTVTDSEVTTGTQLLAQVAYEAPTSKDLDEVEMDALDIKCTSGAGQFTMYIRGMDGYIADKFKINYIIEQ